MKAKTTIFVLAILFFSVGSSLAAPENGDALFQQANEAYSRGEYEQATSMYLQIMRNYGVSASLLYNLGNSYAASGQPGRAIANYERSLRLDPGNQDARYSLAQVRKNNGLYLENRPLQERLAGILSPDQWALLATTGLFVCGITVFATALWPSLPRTFTRVLITCGLLLVVVGAPSALLTYRHWNNGVVIAPGVRLLISPFDGTASVGTLKEGRVVIPDKHHNNYIHVTDETGRSGWLDSSVITLLNQPPEMN